MLTPQQIRQVRRYGRLSAMSTPALVMAFVTPVLWLVLVTIDSFFLEAPGFYGAGLFAAIAFALVDVFLFGYCMLTLRMGAVKDPWKQICMTPAEGYGSAMDRTAPFFDSVQAQADSNQIGAAGMSIHTVRRQVKALGERHQFRVPSRTGYALLVVLVPIIAMVGLFLPRFMQSNALLQQKRTAIGRTMTQAHIAFRGSDYEVRTDDPACSADYWNITAHHKDNQNSYVYVDVNSKGELTSFSYHIRVDDEKTPQENLEVLQTLIREVNTCFASTPLPIVVPAVTPELAVPEELLKDYLADPTGKSFSSCEKDDLHYTFSMNPGNSPYFYFSVGIKKY